MLDFSDLPVVDAHCHPYTRADKLSPEEWVDALAFGGGSPAYLQEGGIEVDAAAQTMLGRLKRDTLYFRFMLRRLAEYFGVEATLEAVVAARNRAIARDGYAQYAGGLHGAGNIDALIVDDGYPLPQIDLDKFRAEVGVEVLPVFRIEVLIQDLLDDDCGWAEFGRRYDESIAEALGDGGYRGLKSIIAYRAGLDIDPDRPSEESVSGALAGWTPGSRLEDVVLLRHCLWVGLGVAEDFGIPLQLHSGFGDRDLELWRADPTRFTPWLRRIPRSVNICFLHCWPYHRQAAYLAAVYPNVYIDTGEVNTHAALGYDRILAETLEVAPFEKVLYSSDAFGLPELYYIGSMRFRSALSSLLEDWQRRGFCSPSDAAEVATAIGRSNAEKLYRLGR